MKSTRSAPKALALLSLLFVACRDTSAPRSDVRPPVIRAPKIPLKTSSDRRVIPNDYIVVFDESVSDVHGRARALAQIANGNIKAEFKHAIRGFAAHMSPQAAAALAEHPGVDYVEPDAEVSVSGTETAATWGLDRIDQARLPLNGTYSFGPDGSGVNVYIIDTGIRSTHTQFGGRVVPAYTTIGDSFYTEGCHFHGTHVAATVGGSTYGVAKGATLYAVRVLDCVGGGSISSVIQGIDWVTANRKLPAVANMSLGGGFSAALNTAVENSIKAGVTYVVAAGNSASDACGYSPASVSGAVTVGATASNDTQAGFSNWGTCVDIMAPGASILSAWNTDDYATGTASGTSMASPHVAGAAALYLQSNPSATPEAVAQAILGNATSGVLTSLGSWTPNRLLRVNGSSAGETAPSEPTPPPSAPPTTSTPVATFSFACQSNNKGACTFDGSASTSSAGITTFAWNFGDGSTSMSAANPRVSHSYTSRGTYIVTLIVTDGNGKQSQTTRKISVKSVSK